MPKLEPISNVKTEPCRLGPERLAGASAARPTQKNPLNYLFEISPPIFLFFLVEKGVFWVGTGRFGGWVYFSRIHSVSTRKK